MRSLLPSLLVLVLLSLCSCQSTTTNAAPKTPSRVADPTQDTDYIVGVFQLSTSLPPVVDGDTIRVDGLDESLRLLFLDTEETFKKDANRKAAANDWEGYVRKMNEGRPADRPAKYGTPMGDAAKGFAQQFFAGITEVRLEYDDVERKRGYYNRHLVHVLANKDGHLINFNIEMVRQGYSPYFTKYGRSKRYHAALLAAEAEARAAKRGIWGSPPAHKCYPNYKALLAWWSDRDEALMKVDALRKSRDDVYLLGIDSEWDRLKLAKDKVVTVIGSLGDLDEKKDRIDIQYIGHRNRLDFAVVGDKGAFKNHALVAHPGDLLLITGKVSMYRDRPQFRVETISVKRVE